MATEQARVREHSGPGKSDLRLCSLDLTENQRQSWDHPGLAFLEQIAKELNKIPVLWPPDVAQSPGVYSPVWITSPSETFYSPNPGSVYNISGFQYVN